MSSPQSIRHTKKIIILNNLIIFFLPTHPTFLEPVTGNKDILLFGPTHWASSAPYFTHVKHDSGFEHH